MNLKIVKIVLLVCLIITGCNKETTTPKPDTDPEPKIAPNILLIIADDLGIEAVPGYDTESLKAPMPNLENLMSDGVTFSNAWSYPVCSPTRAAILTGKFGFRTGVVNVGGPNLSSDETSLHSILKSEGYSTALIGKWHLSRDQNQPGNMGVDYFAGILGGGVGDYSSWNLIENGSQANTNEYTTTKFTDLAINWIGNQTTPWFCWMAYNASHNPIHLPPDHMHSFGHLSDDQASIEKDEVSYFLAMNESLDYDMGRLLDNLPSDQRSNTIIIFVGDNGTSRNVIQSPYNTDQRKGSLYEGGIRVPMVISGTGVDRKGETEVGLVNVVDLFKTIGGLAGASYPNTGDGFDFTEILSTAGVGPRNYNFSESQGSPGPYRYSIRNDQYKIIVTNNNENNFEMYDLSVDPFEKTDLADQSLTEELNSIKQSLIQQVVTLKQ